MTEPTSSFPLYIEFLFLLLGAIASLVVYFLLRMAVTRSVQDKKELETAFFSRLNFPLVFLVLFLCLRWDIVRVNLFPSGKMDNYLNAGLLFFIIFFLIRYFDLFLCRWHARRSRLFPVPRVLHGFILAILYIVSLFIILNRYMGLSISTFLTTSALLTMILGLALQGVLSNILSGLSLHFIKSFSKGDWVKISGHEGIVLDTNWRETRIFDRQSNIIILPNNVVASEKFTNFSNPDKRTALTFPVKVSSDASPSDVFAALAEAASDVPDILASPKPQTYILSFDDFGLDYELKFWITDFSRKHPIMGEVGKKIWYRFQRRNIQIPVPVSEKVMDIIRSVNTDEKRMAVEQKVKKNFNDLMNSSFLRYDEGENRGELMLDEKHVQSLATRIRRLRFDREEVIFRQGDRGEQCYVVSCGRIKGSISCEEPGKTFTTEFVLERGALFGEMSLFTGMPRTASVIAEEETEVLEITAEDFAVLLVDNDELSESIADMVSRRNSENRSNLEKIKELSAEDIDLSTNKKSIIKRLKGLVAGFIR